MFGGRPGPRPAQFGGAFELDYEEGVSVSSGMTYDEVFWFPSFCHDLVINDIPAGSGEPVRKDATVSGMEHVFGCTGTQVVNILGFGLDSLVVWHCGLI
jgi:hypothetical protein